MSKIKSKLFGKSNAVLTYEGEFVAIIGCGKNEDITSKVSQAIVDHFCIETEGVNTFKVNVDEVLTNEKTLLFSVEYTEDEEENLRDFELNIVASY